jgi:hypothetical protein
MRRGIVLSLDTQLDAHIRKMWAAFEREGIGITPGKLLETPHVTIAEASSSEIEPLWQAAVETPFETRDVHLVPFGVFPGKKCIVYYTVILSEGLLKSYLSFYNLLRQKKAAYNPLCDPGHILFHCTIAIDVEAAELPKAIEVLSREKETLSGCVSNVEFWEHFPTRLIRKKDLAKKSPTADPGVLPNE